MKAIAYRHPGPIDRPGAFVEIDLPEPTPGPHDLLVSVEAVSVNPVDTKIRQSAAAPEGGRVLGWDAAGTVIGFGSAVTGFAVGDQVYYAGSIDRPGTNAQRHVVDARIAARRPNTLSAAEAAALPLTALTAYEMLFDRLNVERAVPGSDAILIIGGAGGVGSMAIQLARALTGLTVIATGSRPETAGWVRQLGAHHVLDHSRSMAAQLAELGVGAPGFVFSTTASDRHLADIAEIIAPQGRFGLIDDPSQLDIMAFKRKAVSVHWELMFTRPLFGTVDIARQGEILARVAGLVDEGRVRSTATEILRPLSVENLRQAHALVESGRMRGKVVLEGFAP